MPPPDHGWPFESHLGHPVGATGAILMTKLVYELQLRKAKYGLQTMCIGHGMATATVIERV